MSYQVGIPTIIIRRRVCVKLQGLSGAIVHVAEELCSNAFLVTPVTVSFWATPWKKALTELDVLRDSYTWPFFWNLCNSLSLLSPSRSTCHFSSTSIGGRYCGRLGMICYDTCSSRQRFLNPYQQAAPCQGSPLQPWLLLCGRVSMDVWTLFWLFRLPLVDYCIHHLVFDRWGNHETQLGLRKLPPSCSCSGFSSLKIVTQYLINLLSKPCILDLIWNDLSRGSVQHSTDFTLCLKGNSSEKLLNSHFNEFWGSCPGDFDFLFVFFSNQILAEGSPGGVLILWSGLQLHLLLFNISIVADHVITLHNVQNSFRSACQRGFLLEFC